MKKRKLNSSVGKPRPQSRGIRPQAWKSGPDPLDHLKYLAWNQHRNQSIFRNEPWDITFEQYKELWKHRWHQRGRTKDTYCLTRIDYDQPWTWDNVEIIGRADHNRRQSEHRQRRQGLL